MSTDEIDALLERYLHLLDQYTALRTELGTLQSSVTAHHDSRSHPSPNIDSKSDPPRHRSRELLF